MTTSPLVQPVALGRPWTLRAWEQLLEVWSRWRAERRARRLMERELAELAVVAALDERMLRDVGLPGWAQQHSLERTEAARFERAVLGITPSASDPRDW